MAKLSVDPVGPMGSCRFCTSTEVPLTLTIPSTGSWTLWALATSAFDGTCFFWMYICACVCNWCVYLYLCLNVLKHILYRSDGASPSKGVVRTSCYQFWDRFARNLVTFHIVCRSGLNVFVGAISSRLNVQLQKGNCEQQIHLNIAEKTSKQWDAKTLQNKSIYVVYIHTTIGIHPFISWGNAYEHWNIRDFLSVMDHTTSTHLVCQ